MIHQLLHEINRGSTQTMHAHIQSTHTLLEADNYLGV